MADCYFITFAVDGPVLPVWKSNFWVPHAIDASSSPQLHLLDGVEGYPNSLVDFHTDTGSRGPISKTGLTLSGDGPTAGSSAMPPLITCA